jgi:energy-coupling factor transporter ATP-binding protein EcfA2
MANIALEHVTKRYADGFEAVKDLNLEIADGEFMILVGPSGCGKSTALAWWRASRTSRGSQVVARLAAESRVRQVEEAELWCDSDRLHLFDAESGRSLLSDNGASQPEPDAQPSGAS